MIDKQKVTEITNEWLNSRADYFLVDVTVSKENRVVVEIDHPEGVWIDDCVELSRHIESRLPREVEDYELEVGSAGIDQPFKVIQQYRNHVGQEVEVLPLAGSKMKGVLESVLDDCFTLQTRRKQLVEGSKRPKMVPVTLTFRYDEIKYTKYVISLK